MFKDITEAYSVLSDKEKKRRYDLGQDVDGPDMSGFGGGVNPFDLFSTFFGGGMGGGFSSGQEDGGSGPFSFSSFPGFGSMGGGGNRHFTFKFG